MRRNLGSDNTTVNDVVDNNANTIENTYVEALMRSDTGGPGKPLARLYGALIASGVG
jgi:hypothetical protein